MNTEPQQKPSKRLNYKERLKAGLVKPKPRAAMKKASKPLRKVSKAKAPAHAAYAKWIAVALAATESCARCKKSGVGLEPHHPKGRGGQYLFCVIGLCHNCHEWTHANPNSAMAEGWLHPEYRGLKPDPQHPKPWEAINFFIRRFTATVGDISLPFDDIKAAKAFIIKRLEDSNVGGIEIWSIFDEMTRSYAAMSGDMKGEA